MNKRPYLFLILLIPAVAGALYVPWAREEALVASLPRTTSLNGPFSAREGVEEATRIARLWDQGCRLQCIRIGFRGDPHADDPAITFDGMPIPPSGWMYRFFSRERGSFLLLTLTPDGRCEAELHGALNYMDSQPLPADFLDSREAFRIADDEYGREFRDDGPVFRMYAQLTTWPAPFPSPADPVAHRPTWQIRYIHPQSKDARFDLFLILDAVTGEVLAVTEADTAGQTRIVHDALSNR